MSPRVHHGYRTPVHSEVTQGVVAPRDLMNKSELDPMDHAIRRSKGCQMDLSFDQEESM